MLDAHVTDKSASWRPAHPADNKQTSTKGKQTPANDRDRVVNVDPAAYNIFESTKEMPHRVFVEPTASAAALALYALATRLAAPSDKQGSSPYDLYERPEPLPETSGSPAPSAAYSLDRSCISTPPVLDGPGMHRSPPPQRDHEQLNHYATYDPPGYSGGDIYAPQPTEHNYQAHPDDRQYAPQVQYQPYDHQSYVPCPLPSAPQVSNGEGGGAAPVMHTDDAGMKLSDRVRRRCFNCCTTDTSTWRRSILSPGKVLCNKCGLFERTHSRPRPEQFPHTRAPFASSTLRSRSPPPVQQPYPGYSDAPLPLASASTPPQASQSQSQAHLQPLSSPNPASAPSSDAK
ncbi:hypothetical protein DFH06DRAFT_1219311 [Mycena polygramma]|nr:hypothetical protein DFH06DRAFT_1219311 [Mycena polygramma]